MGDFSIHIQGSGAHHNPKDTSYDADKMAKEFVGYLKKAGHSISIATFTHGGKDDLLKTEKEKV